MILDAPVRFAGGIRLHKPGKFLIPGLIVVLQQLFHHGAAKQEEFPFIPHTKSRIDVQLVIVLPDDSQTEAVNGRNPGVGNHGRLHLQMTVFRVLLQFFIDGQKDALPHLIRRRLRKCHNQKLIDVQGILSLRDHADNPLHQNRCLSAARCRGNEKIAVSAFNDRLLFFCPVNRHPAALLLSPAIFLLISVV